MIVATYLGLVKAADDVKKTYKALHNIFNVAKHKEIFEECQKDHYPNEPLMAASSLTEVRWACKFEGVNTIVRRFKAILVSLQKTAAENSNQSDVAAGLYQKMLSGRFIVSLCFLHRVLTIMNGLSKAMQEVNIKWIPIASEMLAVRERSRQYS